MSLSLMILTGQSGSGKSTAKRALEDNGYFCVDNLPSALVRPLLKQLVESGEVQKIALVMDARDSSFIESFPKLIEELKTTQHNVHVVYFEATEEVLIRRFSETRRPHPMDEGKGLRASIRTERKLLAPLRELANETIESSSLTPHELRKIAANQLAGQASKDYLKVECLSFGFKYGVPLTANLVFDVRFLKNPYFVPEMRERTGLNQDVKEYVLGTEDCQSLLEHIMGALRFLVPRYQNEGKRYLTVAIGCTGGQHRSVAISEEISRRLQLEKIPSTVRHRDTKEPTS
ncbi:MAG: RNase adapter RapZ [Deltaproteobacteria bacterium]|jgi:RNase adapter protein RapZ|nr:RNase adapter RapZ [Deltaproteobacteria bacterium]MBT6432580.1 RNase adapter RapZ [Deltaproteobacteria bacterium]MBT6489322.1 RNase adapter RapZ [Deltaproteobacteria bacterium]